MTVISGRLGRIAGETEPDRRGEWAPRAHLTLGRQTVDIETAAVELPVASVNGSSLQHLPFFPLSLNPGGGAPSIRLRKAASPPPMPMIQ